MYYTHLSQNPWCKVLFCPLQLIETQAEYHRKSLEILHSILPQIKAHQGESVCVCVCVDMLYFGTCCNKKLSSTDINDPDV